MTTSYANSVIRQYTFAAKDFGAADTTEVIPHPLAGRDSYYGAAPKMRGRVKGFGLFNVTEIFAGTTLMAGVEVGDGTDPDKYFKSETSQAKGTTNGLAVGKALYVLDSGSGVSDIGADDTGDLTITFKGATGTPTGIADVTVDIEWFDI
jgi:hypothetical protein